MSQAPHHFSSSKMKAAACDGYVTHKSICLVTALDWHIWHSTSTSTEVCEGGCRTLTDTYQSGLFSPLFFHKLYGMKTAVVYQWGQLFQQAVGFPLASCMGEKCGPTYPPVSSLHTATFLWWWEVWPNLSPSEFPSYSYLSCGGEKCGTTYPLVFPSYSCLFVVVRCVAHPTPELVCLLWEAA